MKLKDRVAVVTAAAGAGIGQAVARRFAEEGAQVVISDAHAKRAHEVATKIQNDFGREVSAFGVDVKQKDQVEAMVRATLERFGQIDILFNNAGINKLEPVWEMTEETWDLVLGVCLTGTFRVTRAVLPHMIAQRRGVIVSMASVAGWIASDTGQAHYCAAKAGVMAFTRSVAAECSRHGIRANAIAPGLIYNEFLSRIYPPDFFEKRSAGAPLGRLGEPADKAFCAGGDVNWEKGGGLRRQVLEPYMLHVSVSPCPKPVMARVNGYAIGGGNHLAYFCDFTIAAEHAIFGQNGPRVGSPAGGPIVSYLAHIIGQKRAREMWMLCRRYTAQQALTMGLVNAVVPLEKLDEEVDRWCEELLAVSPTCLKILKASFVAEFDAVLGQGDAIRRLVVGREFWEEEQQEGARAFLEKRKPAFSRFRRRR